MKLTIDVENTAQKTENGKLLLDPFTPDNQLVLACTKQDDGVESSFWFNHSTHSTENAKQLLQDQLDKASEADIVFCITKTPMVEGQEDESLERHWLIVKNKLTGQHGRVVTILDPLTGRFAA